MNTEKFIQDAQALQKLAKDAHFPASQMNLLTCFGAILEKLIEKLQSRSLQNEQELDCGAIYQLVRMHAETFNVTLPKTTTPYSYGSYLISPTEEQKYYNQVLKFLSTHKSLNDELCNPASEVAKRYVEKTHHVDIKGVMVYRRGYDLGDDNAEAVSSVEKLEKRLFVLNYFACEKDFVSTCEFRQNVAGVGFGGAMVAFPPAVFPLLLTYGFGSYLYLAPADQIKVSLEAKSINDFYDLQLSWDTELRWMIGSPERKNTVIALFTQEQGESNQPPQPSLSNV